MKKITVIIPTCNEKKDGYLSRFLAHYQNNDGVEFLVVDDGSSASLLRQVQQKGWRLLSLDSSNRAQRLSFGLKNSSSDLVCFHHPRSTLPREAFLSLLETSSDWRWGGFTHSFERSSLGLRWTSWYSNFMRAQVQRILYLDHCIFFHRDLMNKEIPNVPIFEDTEISKILRKKGLRPFLHPLKSVTSSVRFSENGFWKQSALNQIFKVGYHLKFSTETMDRIYEKKLNLNSRKPNADNANRMITKD